MAKRLRLLHDIVPKAVRVAVLVNPANASITETTLNIVQEAARAIGLQTEIINARTISEMMRSLQAWRASAPMPSSSLQTGFSSAVPCNLPP